MKKIIFMALSLTMVSSLALAVEPSSSQEADVPTETVAQIPTTVSKSDSFMMAFGMADSSVVSGGESGGESSGASSSSAQAATAVAQTTVHTGATSLTSSQNTPYYYGYK